MTWQTIGLLWFIAVAGGTVVVLLVDAALVLTSRKTITERTRELKWPAFLILVLLMSGVAGLAMHFMGGP